jgi:Fic family protein
VARRAVCSDQAGYCRHRQENRCQDICQQVHPSCSGPSPRLLREFFDWYTDHKDRAQAAVLAALVHLKFVTIYPFADGNGRISRLMMNFVLNRRGFPLLNIPYDVSSYYKTLERAQMAGRSEPFVTWFIKRYLEECRHLQAKTGEKNKRKSVHL